MTQLEMQPIQKKSAETQATELLRTHITSGQIAPASRITEVQLAEQLHVSRPTVRTALHQLAGEGLIVQIPYTGWMVSSLSAIDAWELYTLRASLESLAARLTTQRLNPTGQKLLEAALKALRDACKAKDWAAIAEADFSLHRQIVALANHARLETQYQLIEHHVRMYIASSDALTSDANKIIRDHQPIIQAILEGDANLAAQRIESHITSDGELLVAHLRSLEKNTLEKNMLEKKTLEVQA
jgi:DNA-binding GntR family transcriptional regulator